MKILPGRHLRNKSVSSASNMSWALYYSDRGKISLHHLVQSLFLTSFLSLHNFLWHIRHTVRLKTRTSTSKSHVNKRFPQKIRLIERQLFSSKYWSEKNSNKNWTFSQSCRYCQPIWFDLLNICFIEVQRWYIPPKKNSRESLTTSLNVYFVDWMKFKGFKTLFRKLFVIK